MIHSHHRTNVNQCEWLCLFHFYGAWSAVCSRYKRDTCVCTDVLTSGFCCWNRCLSCRLPPSAHSHLVSQPIKSDRDLGQRLKGNMVKQNVLIPWKQVSSVVFEPWWPSHCVWQCDQHNSVSFFHYPASDLKSIPSASRRSSCDNFKKALSDESGMVIYPHYFNLSVSQTQFPLLLLWGRTVSKAIIVKDLSVSFISLLILFHSW